MEFEASSSSELPSKLYLWTGLIILLDLPESSMSEVNSAVLAEALAVMRSSVKIKHDQKKL